MQQTAQYFASIRALWPSLSQFSVCLPSSQLFCWLAGDTVQLVVSWVALESTNISHQLSWYPSGFATSCWPVLWATAIFHHSKSSRLTPLPNHYHPSLTWFGWNTTAMFDRPTAYRSVCLPTCLSILGSGHVTQLHCSDYCGISYRVITGPFFLNNTIFETFKKTKIKTKIEV